MAGDQTIPSPASAAKSSDARNHAGRGATDSSSLGGDLLTQRPAARPKQTGVAPARFTSYSAFKQSADAYWQKVDAAKHKHTLIAQFPPLLVRENPPTVQPPPETDLLNKNGTLPSLNDMTKLSKQLARFAFRDKKQPDFSLGAVDEAEFKSRYAGEATRVGQQNGFDKTQVQSIVQSIYAFEDGGWGTHETLSGMPSSLVVNDQTSQTANSDERDQFHPRSTGIGYNQLLRATTMLNLDQHGDDIVASLKMNAQKEPQRRDQLLAKADLVQHLKASMDKELNSLGRRLGGKGANAFLSKEGVPTDLLYQTFAKSSAPTSFGLPASEFATAIHSLNLDGDIGPIMQAQELSGLLRYAHSNNFEQLLSTEVKKKTAHASAYDALSVDKKTKAVDELFSLVHPASISQSSTIPISDQDVASLRAKLLNLKAGTDDSVDRQNLTPGQYALLNLGLLTLRKVAEPSGPLSPNAALLLDKLTVCYRGGLTAESLIPAAVELVNLAGEGSASQMLAPANGDFPTANFFSRSGYTANAITNERSADELLMQIDRIMHGLNRDPKKPGQAQFEKVFQE